MIYFGCFHSQATGNIYIKCSTANIFSNNIQIEDCIRYDNTTTDKTNTYTLNKNKYGTSIVNLSFDTDHYVLSGNNWCRGGITFDEVENMDNIQIEFEAKLTQNNNYNQILVGLYNETGSSNKAELYRLMGKNLQTLIQENETTLYTHSTNYLNKYYRLVFKKINNKIYIELYDGDNLLHSNNFVLNLVYNQVYYAILTHTERGSSYQVLLKNIKVKSL